MSTEPLASLSTEINKLSTRINHSNLPWSVHTTHDCGVYKTKRKISVSDIYKMATGALAKWPQTKPFNGCDLKFGGFFKHAVGKIFTFMQTLIF